MGVIYGDNRKENGNYYLGFRVPQQELYAFDLGVEEGDGKGIKKDWAQGLRFRVERASSRV